MSHLPPIARAPLACQRSIRVVFAGGGTGGHVCPAVAVARALERVAPGSEALFLGSGRAVERRILEPTGLRHEVVASAPGTNPVRFAWAAARGLLRARALLRAFRPDVVCGLGGFASVPGALAGASQGVPLALFEPNATPGKANAWLSRLAREAHVAWPAVQLACPLRETGVPLNAHAVRAELTQGEAREALGLPRDGRVVLVMGGSQGARAINRWVEAALPNVDARGVAFVHLAGGDEAAKSLKVHYGRAGVPAAVHPFLTDVGLAYRAADLAVVRGGAGTLAELLANGLPARVIPLAGTAGDHQVVNAHTFAALGAGDVLAETDLGRTALAATLAQARDEGALATRREAAARAARPGAAEAVARRLVALAHGEAAVDAAPAPVTSFPEHTEQRRVAA